MKRTPITILALLGLFVLGPAHAQEKPTVEKAEAEVAEESVESDEGSQGSDENFIPTEKINVDSSVSFPVDI